MAGSDRWYFSKEVLANTPSRRCGIDADKELSYRQQAANLIQDMGQRLHVSQLCINTAIVYMHRFYTFHSFTKFHRNSISSCALFLAAKVEEQPRKLEHVIKVSHMCLHRETPSIDIKSEAYQEQAMELVFNENLMLQTLGFDIAVEHPHTSVVNCCQLVRASKDLAQTSYFMATNSLHLTTMCLQYKPTVVACVCIHLACKWSSWEIPRSSEGKDWFYYVDKTVTLELLERLTSEFLAILDKCPSRLKRKIMAGSGGNPSATNAVSLNKSNDEKKSVSHLKDDIKPSIQTKTGLQPSNETIGAPTSPLMKKIKTEPSAQQSNKIPVAMSYAAYRERKERTQQDSKQLEQSVKSNQSIKSLPPFTTRESIGPQKDKFNVSDKISAKQQQINIDKQKQIEERHKLKTKNPEYLWDNSSNNRQTTSSKPISSSIHTKTPNNVITEDFYENLLNKPSNFNSIFSTDGEDSLEFKKEITTDLKMEFSDNSNLSNDALNLSSFPTDFINDSSDSKKSFNNNSNNNNNNNKLQTNAETKTTSFMSIFSSPVTNPNPIITPTVNLKSENITTNIPMKYSSNDFQNMLSRLKPEPPPPMLSPLKSAVEIESVPKLEKPLYPTHSSSVPHMKSSSNQNLDSKQIPNLKSKTPPKNRNLLQSKPSIGVNLQNSPKEKEVIESSHNIGLDINMNQTSVEPFSSVNNNCNNNNNFNSNDLSHTSESIAPVSIKQEKPSKGGEVPSALSHNRTQMSSTSNPEIDIKPNIDFISNVKPSLHSSPPQKLINNINLIPDQSSILTKATTLHNKDVKEKSHEERHSDKHHKHSHHSHKSSKHKDKHKHKHKDKDREKHKRKDKDRDRDREKDREKHNDSKEDPSYKLSWSSPKEKSEVSTINSNIAPIKLKISKKKLSIDSPDKDNDVPQNPLKLRIQLKDQKLTANTTDFESNDLTISSERKRKSSPKSSKKEKKLKYETDFNSKSKEDKNSTKTSSKSSKKSNDSNNSKKNSNSMSDERYSTQTINSFGHQMLNLGISGQPLGGPQGVGSQRSKAHK